MFLPERLTASHELAKFDCGVPSLNDWLRRTAITPQAKGVTVTDVWSDAGRVVAYYFVPPPRWCRTACREEHRPGST